MDREDFPSDDDYMDAVADHRGLCRVCFAPLHDHAGWDGDEGTVRKVRLICPD